MMAVRTDKKPKVTEGPAAAPLAEEYFDDLQDEVRALATQRQLEPLRTLLASADKRLRGHFDNESVVLNRLFLVATIVTHVPASFLAEEILKVSSILEKFPKSENIPVFLFGLFQRGIEASLGEKERPRADALLNRLLHYYSNVLTAQQINTASSPLADIVRSLVDAHQPRMVGKVLRALQERPPVFVAGYREDIARKAAFDRSVAAAEAFLAGRELGEFALDESIGGSQTGGVSKLERAIDDIASVRNVSRETVVEVLTLGGILEPAKTELTKMPLPKKARVLYADRHKHKKLAGSNIVDFLRAEYGPWLNGQMSRAQLRTLDSSAYQALQNWLRNNELPESISLPIHKEVTEKRLKAIALGQVDRPTGKNTLTTMISRKTRAPRS